MTETAIDITHQITTLLSRYGVVRVPGLGTFAAEHRNASVHSNLLLPPGDVVVFTPDTNNQNDNTLAEQVMRDYNLTFVEALNAINQSIATLNIPSLCGWQDYLPANVGLHSLTLNEINRGSFVGDLAKYAAVVAAAVLLNLAVPYNNVDHKGVSEASIVPESFENVARPAEQPVAEAVENEVRKEYCVIVSSLNTREDAVNWAVAHNMCDSAEVLESKCHFRVSAARFATYTEAETFIKNKNLKAWVFHDKE